MPIKAKIGAAGRWISKNPQDSYLLLVADDRFHYEAIQQVSGRWNLYFGDDLKRQEPYKDNDQIGSYASETAAREAAAIHLQAQRAALPLYD